MSHIYIYSPSSAVRDRKAFKRGISRLEALGHEVEVDDAALLHHMRFAGDDACRLAAVGRAAASNADVALISRGGYGLTRILPQLPFKAISKAIDKGMQLVGLSDFTALQMALLSKTGQSTWAGPALIEDFGCESEPDEIMQACFGDITDGVAEGTGWRMKAADCLAMRERLGKRGKSDDILLAEHATVWGGNLSVLCSLVGTPWLPKVEKGILFIEDVNEHPYRVERMLSQLLLAGVLQNQKAILMGSFTRFKPVPGYDRGFGLGSVVQWLRDATKVPVVTGLPFGHIATKVALPVGRKADLMVSGRDVLMMWEHTHEDRSHGH